MSNKHQSPLIIGLPLRQWSKSVKIQSRIISWRFSLNARHSWKPIFQLTVYVLWMPSIWIKCISLLFLTNSSSSYIMIYPSLFTRFSLTGVVTLMRSRIVMLSLSPNWSWVGMNKRKSCFYVGTGLNGVRLLVSRSSETPKTFSTSITSISKCSSIKSCIPISSSPS